MVRAYMHSAMPAFANAPKEGETVPSKFMGGYYGVSKSFTISGTTFSAQQNITGLNAGKLGFPNIPIFPWWGAWCEDHFEGYCYFFNGELHTPLGYFIYNPLINQVTEFKNIKDPAVMASYHPIDKKIYALNIAETGIELYSASPNTGVFTKIENPISGIADEETPVAMAISQEGKMYVIARGVDNSSLYEVNISTSAATKIGNTGIVSDGDSFQSATFDARTGNLYWSYWDVAANEGKGAGMVATVSTTDGKATIVNNDFDELNALSCIYYTKKKPVTIADFGLSYDGVAEKITGTFTVPSLDINGDALTVVDSVFIYRLILTNGVLTDMSLVYKNGRITPGQKIEANISAAGLEGTHYFAIRTQKDDEYSGFAEASVLCFKVPMPYTNGFEASDDDLTAATVSIEPANATIEKVSTQNHTTDGTYSYQVNSAYLTRKNYNILRIDGIPVKKGAAYTISFWVKGDKGAGQNVVCFNLTSTAGWIKTLTGTDWEQLAITLSATTSGQMSIGFGGDGNVYYIDDVKIEETGAPSRPAKIAINGVTAAEDGTLKAKVNVTLPNQDAAGEALTAISKIKLSYANAIGGWSSEEGSGFMEFTGDFTPGVTQDFEITVPKAGRYYLKGWAYNDGGESPMFEYLGPDGRLFAKTPWIGYDTLAAKVTVKATPQTDGKSKLEWSKAKGANGGYVGEVTYTVKKGDTKLYEGTDTTCVTSSALDLGMNVLTMSFVNTQPDIREDNNKSQTIYALGGLSADMIYCNAYNGLPFYSQFILNTSATENNSALTQVMYPKTDKAIYIDNLLIFTDAPDEAPETAAEETIKVYMGTTDKEEFDAFIEKEQLTLVYDGKLTFEVGKNTHNLPLSGFYYDGTKNLVISIVKPKQDKTSFDAWAFMGSEFPTKKDYIITSFSSTETDFDALTESYNASVEEPGIDAFTMAMMAKPAAASALRALKVTVKDVDVSNEGVANAVIDIKKDATKEGKNLTAQIKTNEDGVAEFAYMPMGNFKVTVKARGFATQTIDLEIAENTPVTKELTIDFKRATKVKFEGTVTDKAGLKLSDVKVKADDGFDAQDTTTNAEGVFIIKDVYSMNDYTLTFEKAGMQTLTQEFSLGEKDSVIAEAYKMAYTPIAVPYAAVSLNNEGSAVVTWAQPAVSVNAFWTTKATRTTRFTYDNKEAIKYAQRFLPTDLSAMNLGSAKLIRFGFMPGSTTAKYSIVIANDTTQELYRYEVPTEKLVAGEWCDFEVPAKAIDTSKQLWLIVEVAADAQGNQNYPIVVEVPTGTNTYAGKGNLMWAKGKWSVMTALNANITGNVRIRATLQDDNTKIEAPNGYKIYRGKVEDKFEDYTLLNAENVKDGKTYTDATYANATFGVYNYAVVADFYDTDLSKPTYTNTVNKDMEFNVTFNITSNAGAGKSEGAYVYLIDTSLTNRSYSATAGADGKATIAKKVWRDKYIYEITLPYHKKVTDTLYLTQDTTVNVSLEEVIVNPGIVSTMIEGKNVVMTYGVNLDNWVDNVESYEDFAIANLGAWTTNSGAPKVYLTNISWKNNKEPQSWIVMNFSKTSPALTNYGYEGASGKKCFMAWGASSQTIRYDLLVRPVSKGGGKFRFAVAAFNGESPENFAVVYSGTTADSAAFQPVPKGEVKNFSNENWKTMSFDIPEDAKFIGIRYAGNKEKYGLMVDDLVYAAEDFAKPASYDLYVDGEKKGSSEELTYTLENLSIGEHTVGVKAIYGSGASEMVTKKINISNEAAPIRLTVKIDCQTALLTWKTPEGFAPKSYKVFLGEEMKIEGLTETTYVFNDLALGNYTAGVVAVYKTGESEKVTVSFMINVGVEDIVEAVRAMVYPNPNNGLFYLQTNGAGEVEVYNLRGQMVVRKAVAAEGIYEINLQNREKGAYVLRFTGSDRTQTVVKLIVR